MAALGNTAYFSAVYGPYGYELWKTDGTSAGTALVRDINTHPGFGSNPDHFAMLGGALYFIASDGLTNGVELWRTDASAAGAVLVKAPTRFGSEIHVFTRRDYAGRSCVDYTFLEISPGPGGPAGH